MDTVRVRIADDHPFFWEAMHGCLDRMAEGAVVGETEIGDEAVQWPKGSSLTSSSWISRCHASTV
jgi:DNA-binding NarL/FixJ family response regulator